MGTFISRKDRLKDMGHNTRFTNLYVKNFGEEVTDEDLRNLFAEHGTIISAVVMKDRNTGKSMGFGFVSFDDHESAAGVSFGGCDVAGFGDCPICGMFSIGSREDEYQGGEWKHTLRLPGTEKEGKAAGVDA